MRDSMEIRSRHRLAGDEQRPTGVARDLSRIILSQCPLIAFFSISHKVLSQKQLVEISFL